LFRLSCLLGRINDTELAEHCTALPTRTWLIAKPGRAVRAPSTLPQKPPYSASPPERQSRCSRSPCSTSSRLRYRLRLEPLEKICTSETATALVSVSAVLRVFVQYDAHVGVFPVSFDCPGSSCPVDAIAAATPVRAHSCQLLRWKPWEMEALEATYQQWCCCQQERH
jgi:hypothetical protein